MYSPRPLPTMPPDFSPYETMYDGIDESINRIVTILRSVPIIPNSNGLYDQNGQWLTPVLSAFDVLAAMFVISVTFLLVIKLSGLSSNLTGGLISYARNHR